MLLIAERAQKGLGAKSRFPLEHLLNMRTGCCAIYQLRQRRSQESEMGMIRRRLLAERLQRISIEARGVLSTVKMTPEALWMMRVPPHCSMNPLDSFRATPQPGQ